ncbi:MAG: hypothetical protein RR843_03450 [Clostridia bacterium]
MAFNFMNRYFYGKAGQADYTPDQLPGNRRQLFFEMLKVRFTGIMGVNLLFVLFCLPALAWTVVHVQLLFSLGAADTAQNYVADGMLLIYLVGMIPCMGLSGIGATGEMYILRNWARDQHSFVMSDFKDAVKGNWKCGLLVGLLNGLSLLLASVCYTFYGQLAQGNMLWIVPQMLSVMLCVVWWMANMLIFPMMVTYEMKFLQLVRNSVIMAIARLPWSVLFLAITALVPALIVFLVPYGYLAMLLFCLLIGFGLAGFIYASYANSCFDRYLNPRIAGAPVNLGMREPDEDEEPQDPEMKV